MQQAPGCSGQTEVPGAGMGRCNVHVVECCSVKGHHRSAQLGGCGVVHTGSGLRQSVKRGVLV